MPPDSSSYSIVSGDTFYAGTQSYDSLVRINTDAFKQTVDEQKKDTVSTYNNKETETGVWGLVIFLFVIFLVIFCLQRIPIWFRNLTFWLEEKYPALKTFNDSFLMNDHSAVSVERNVQVTSPGALVYKGKDLEFEDSVLEFVLNKYSPFYVALKAESRHRFKDRVLKFMAAKTFIIYDHQGFREMPILISASAIQVSFGLEHFMMPHYTTIQVHPKEYIGVNPLRILVGNVQGNCINLAWSYFLEGFQYAKDGKNIGLHEMAHALYGQNTYGSTIERNWALKFMRLTDCMELTMKDVEIIGHGLYTETAMCNTQEFWAESIELFFEKPTALFQYHPELYRQVSSILNQDLLIPKMA
jgi:MtfA peptidase